jgi:sensor histidine kinase YesM
MPRQLKPGDTPLKGFLTLLWRQALWAIPFAFFFGTIYASKEFNYLLAYKMSAVFAYSTGVMLWICHYFIEPRIRAARPDSRMESNWLVGAWYSGMAVLGSYIAAVIIHFTILPGFFGSWRAVVISGLFTLLFVALFSGISFARVFYLEAVARARAVEQTRAELAQAELRALRAQIHPHFLFNALNSIAALISVNPRAAEETTTQLADVFRYTLRASGKEYVPLGEELEFLRTVLAIEHTRFGDRLHVVEEIEPGVEIVPVPSLLLQPLVENAVRHGLAQRSEGGTLKLGARRDGQLLKVTIEDDGVGMNPDAPPRGTGFGLHAVRERLRVAGPPHAIDIDTAIGRGTSIVVTLPISPSSPPTLPRGGSS